LPEADRRALYQPLLFIVLEGIRRRVAAPERYEQPLHRLPPAGLPAT